MDSTSTDESVTEAPKSKSITIDATAIVKLKEEVTKALSLPSSFWTPPKTGSTWGTTPVYASYPTPKYYWGSWEKASQGAFSPEPATLAVPPPAPPAPPVKVKKLVVTLAGTPIAARHIRAAIKILTAAPGAATYRPLLAAKSPIAALDLGALAAAERAWTPTGQKPPATLKAGVLAALRRAVDPTRRGPFTLDGAGFCQPISYDTTDMYSFPLPPADIVKAIAKSIGNGRVVGRGHSSMSEATLRAWVRSWSCGDLARCFALEVAHCLRPSPHHPGAPNHPDTHEVTWAPAVAGEIPCGRVIDGDFPSPYVAWSTTDVDAYLLGARMAHAQFMTKTGRRRWCVEHMTGDKHAVDRRSTAACEAAKTNSVYTGTLLAGTTPSTKPGYPQLIADKVPIVSWSTGALAAYARDHDLTLPRFFDGRVTVVQAHRQEAVRRQAVEDAKLKLAYAPDQPTLKGNHRKAVLVDQHGRRWLFKPAPDGNRFRSETEHEAHLLARRWGFRTAESRLETFDGTFGHLQAMLDATGNLLGVDGAGFAALTRTQLCAIAREHVLDWAIDNDDTHGENIVLSADGAAIGIDKGRAWRYFGAWPGLTGDEQADTNCKLIYTKLYAAIAAGHIDRDTVDTMYRSTIAQARRMQCLSDDILAAHITRAVAHRPHFDPSWYQTPIPHAPANADELIAYATKRKNELAADFTNLWQRIYARAGWDIPDLHKALSTNPQHHPLHAGLHSPDLHAAVQTTKSFGTATFVAGTHVEDAHVLLWRERRPDGTHLIRGSFKLRDPHRNAFGQWCLEQVSATSTDTPTLLHEPTSYAAIINAAKTVSFHHQDGQFNEAKLNALALTKTRLTRLLAHNINKVTETHDRVAATVEMCTTYLGYITTIEAHKANRTRSVEGDFPRYTFTPHPPAPNRPIVTLEAANRAAASLGEHVVLDPDGELRLSGERLIDDEEYRGQAGDMFLITLPTGEQITYRCSQTDTPKSAQGLVEFTINDAAAMETGLANIDQALTDAGIELRPADSLDMELFYWRHLGGILASRLDTRPGGFSRGGSPQDPRYATFWSTLSSMDPTTDRAQEADMLRAAFAALTSVETVDAFLAADLYLPRFMHMDLRNPTQPCGKPYWMRFDIADTHWRSKQMPTITYRSGPVWPAETGVAMATEARVRTFAIWKSGMSSFEDMRRGSGAFLFARQNQENIGSPNVYLSPRVLARTHNYAFEEDRYGNISARGDSAWFDFESMTSHTGSSNELCIKDAVSLLDDIEILVFRTAVHRDAATAKLAALGITDIRGVPVAVRFVAYDDHAAIAEAKAAARASYHQDW